MRTIKEAAKSSAKKLVILENNTRFSSEPDLRTAEYLCYKSFKAGVEFSQHMIPIEQELPDVNIDVLVQTKNGKYIISSMYIPKDCHGNILGEKEWKGSHSFKQSIISWRPINLDN